MLTLMINKSKKKCIEIFLIVQLLINYLRTYKFTQLIDYQTADPMVCYYTCALIDYSFIT